MSAPAAVSSSFCRSSDWSLVETRRSVVPCKSVVSRNLEPGGINGARLRNPSGGTREPSDRGVHEIAVSWVARHNRGLTIVSASLCPILYLLFVNRYSTNSFYNDDWSVVMLVHSALHGGLSLSQLWGQYNESRLLLGNMMVVLFAFIDRLDLRSIILFNAAVFIASYVILLALFRRYIGSYLTPIPTIVVGAIWFSVGDFQNSLWAFQMPWYLTVLFLFAMLFALLVPDDHRAFWVAIAVVAAMAGSISTVQGFLLWPLGVICILWNRPRARRALSETAAWCGALLVMLAVYLPGYNFNNNGCYPTSSCTVVSALHHPLAAIQTYFALIGSVIPGASNVPTYFRVWYRDEHCSF